MKACFVDTETFSAVPIAHGTYAYAEAAICELFSYAFSWEPDEIEHIFEPDIEPVPADLQAAIDDPDVIFIAHNAQFDRVIMGVAMGIHIPIQRWRCSMACARSLGLPGSLEKLGEIVGLPEDKQKLKRGKQLVQKFCKPAPKNSKVYRYDRYNSPEDWAEYREYNKGDARALRALWEKLPKWNYKGDELASWHLDQVINDRGIAIDIPFVRRALAATKAKQKEINARMAEATAGIVTTAGKRDALLDYLNAVYDAGLTDLKGATVESTLEGADIPQGLRDILLLRVRGTKTSIGKYKKILEAVSSDGRLKGTITWNGAARTGRMAGRTVQPQNFPRPTMKKDRIQTGIDAVMLGCEDLLFGDDVMDFYSSALRGAFIAPPGRKLVVADLSNIEGRILAWLAGEEWKVTAFREYDAGRGFDLYILAYATVFGVDPASIGKDSDERQIGKVMELALGYHGGVGAFATFALAYNIDLDAMAEAAWDTIPAEMKDKAAQTWEWAVSNGRTHGLNERAFIVCDSFKRMWRMAHPGVVQFWYSIDDAFRAAVANPGESFMAGEHVAIRYANPWLGIRLPSGRVLTYYQPKIDPDSGELSYMGINQFTKRWQRDKTYSGKLCIAAGTPTLTKRGWIPIEQVAPCDVLWDGEEWAHHDGLVYKGFTEVISAHGVSMTPDHEVLTEKGWVRASQSERYNRATCRVPYGYEIHGQRREKLPAGIGLRLRSREDITSGLSAEAGAPGNTSVLGCQNVTVPACQGRGAVGTDFTTKRNAHVFDIVNCGPRRRFVVASEDGRPLIVHNCENIVQAAARDVLVANMPAVEAAGYNICLTVHDEAVTEATDSPEFNVKHLSSILASTPPWARGLPLAASGFEDYRYRK